MLETVPLQTQKQYDMRGQHTSTPRIYESILQVCQIHPRSVSFAKGPGKDFEVQTWQRHSRTDSKRNSPELHRASQSLNPWWFCFEDVHLWKQTWEQGVVKQVVHKFGSTFSLHLASPFGYTQIWEFLQLMKTLQPIYFRWQIRGIQLNWCHHYGDW